MRFAAAPEYHVFPTLERPLKPYEAVVRAARETLPLVREVRPDVVVADILTLAPALAGELRGRAGGRRSSRTSTRAREPGFPPYSLGARLPRTAVGPRGCGGGFDRVVGARPASAGATSSTRRARRLGLPPLDRVHGGISRALVLVATFPQLEYPRAVAGRARTSSGRCCGSRRSARSSCRRATTPLVLVAPSTVAGPRAPAAARGARRASPTLPVRVLATLEPRGR